MNKEKLSLLGASIFAMISCVAALYWAAGFLILIGMGWAQHSMAENWGNVVIWCAAPILITAGLLIVAFKLFAKGRYLGAMALAIAPTAIVGAAVAIMMEVG
jgi:hypothetical protein